MKEFIENQKVISRMDSHQDYANWKLTGSRFYTTNTNWQDINSETEEVISVNGELCVCENCLKTTPGLKDTCNTPSFHNSNFSICYSCTKKAYKEAGGRVVSEEEILAEYFKAFNEKRERGLGNMDTVLERLHEAGHHEFCVNKDTDDVKTHQWCSE